MSEEGWEPGVKIRELGEKRAPWRDEERGVGAAEQWPRGDASILGW